MNRAPSRPAVTPSTGSFPRAARVRKRPEFLRIQALGRRVPTRSFVLLLYAREPHGARLGVTVSRRVGNAVVRNRVKRLVREAFRATRRLFADDLDLVVIVRRAVPEASLWTVLGEWEGVEAELARQSERARRDREDRARLARAGKTGDSSVR